MGIECDGAAYHSSRTARERDRLRQSVLEGMGWKIYRIWSTDWIKDPITEGEELIKAIEKVSDDSLVPEIRQKTDSSYSHEKKEAISEIHSASTNQYFEDTQTERRYLHNRDSS